MLVVTIADSTEWGYFECVSSLIQGDREMKKGFIILVMAIVIPACVFAGNGIIGLTIGATAAYQKAGAVESIESGEFLKELSIDDFKFGADVDVKVLFLDVNGKAFVAKNGSGDTLINGIVSANLALDIAIVRLKAGLGYQYTFNTQTKDIVYGSANGGVKSFDDFKNANFDIHVGADVMLGDLTIGAYATLPTETSIGKGNWGDLFSTVADNWKAAQIGVGVGFSLI